MPVFYLQQIHIPQRLWWNKMTENYFINARYMTTDKGKEDDKGIRKCCQFILKKHTPLKQTKKKKNPGNSD